MSGCRTRSEPPGRWRGLRAGGTGLRPVVGVGGCVVGVRVKPEPPSEETWRACPNPHRLVSWSRPAATARKHLLLACAVARHGLKADRTETGGAVLSAIEELARGPKAGLSVRLIDGYLMPRFPGLFQAGWPWLTAAGERKLGGRPDWVGTFGSFAAVPGQAAKSLPNVMLNAAQAAVPGVAAAEAAAAVAEARREVAARPVRKGAGRFGPLLGWVRGDAGGREQAVCEAALATIPAARRPPVPPGLPAASLGWWVTAQLQAYRAEQARARLCDLVREVMGDPFRRWHPHPEWSTEANPARQVAGYVDATGDYSALPVLADALEDAGCTDVAPLEHCRAGGLHVAGCWVVEAVLRR